MRIVVTNQVALNSGDAAILHGMLAVLRAALGDDAEILVLDRQAEVTRDYYPDISFAPMYRFGLVRRATRRLLGRLDPLGWIASLQQRLARRVGRSRWASWLLPRTLRANLAAFRDADLIVSAGGTYLVEHYRLEEALLQLSLAAASGTPTMLFTQSAGPFRDPANCETLAWLLPRLVLALLRDERSLDHLVEAGLPPERGRMVADAAFALAPASPPRRAQGRGLAVAVSVRSWMFPGHADPAAAEADYIAAIAAAVTGLVRDRGAEITFLSTCQGVPEYRYDDAAFARRVAAALPADVADWVTVDDAFHTPAALIERLAGFDFVLATRMHMAILSLCVGTPVLPVAYEFKTKELFAGIGLGEWVLDIDALDAAAACARVDAFLAALGGLRPALAEQVRVQRASAFSVAPLLAGLVGVAPEAGCAPAAKAA